MPLEVKFYGDPVLRQRGEPIAAFDKALVEFARDMLEAMVKNDGIGLAAQQVGRPLRFFVADLQSRVDEAGPVILDGKEIPVKLLLPFVAANGQIEFLPGKTQSGNEGCLSIPGLRADVPRPNAIRLRYQDIQGRPHILETSGLLARVIQHEYDHTDGVLFIDRIDPEKLKELEPKLKALKKQTKASLKEKSVEEKSSAKKR